MTGCGAVRRDWMDFNLWSYAPCVLPADNHEAHVDADGYRWVDVPAEHAWKTLVDVKNLQAEYDELRWRMDGLEK